ncbi:MAG: DNA recombination protein RmuC [Cardiobacteriaceae bacterium]|nr:DNA recombination protein RmuC [Cardiobacteriaceae bacterium]
MNTQDILPYLPFVATLAPCLLLALYLRGQHRQQLGQLQQLAAHQQNQLGKLREFTLDALHRQEKSLASQQQQQDALLRDELHNSLARFTRHTEQRLADNQHNAQHTFKNIIARLATIDEAQKRLDHLASNINTLQDILTDKRSRGAFGEIQLKTLIDNILPAQHVRYQHTLENGRRPDCCLLLPGDSGILCIDAKFPLESYRALIANADQPHAIKTFRADLQKHIKDIAARYIQPPQTADSAILFLPAEAVFAEIHARHPDLITLAQRLNVWITSPTTLAALLTTLRSLIRDDATHRHARQLRSELQGLHQEFERFQQHMEQLSRHIEQTSRDIHDARLAARRLSQRFQNINQPENTPPQT